MVVNLLAILGLAGYLFLSKGSGKQAFILNQKVFEGFRGKVELEEKLRKVKQKNRRELDSLAKLLKRSGEFDAEGIQTYRQREDDLRLVEQQLSDQYTADIWKRINVYIAGFGKDQGYEFIYGASGDGNLMYATQERDVTDQVIQYINKRYSEGD